jgi:hypothetical protein
MISKSFLAVVLSLSLVLFAWSQGPLAPAVAVFTPHMGDYFSYYEVVNLGSGTGDYAGYTEHMTANGTETVNGVGGDGIASVYYGYSYVWSNSTGTTETGSPSGNFTFSSTTFDYVSGTDDQVGYTNPTVWFCMDNSTPVGGTFYLLDTEMTVKSTNYGFFLPSQNRSVNAIYAQGTSSYLRNDAYGRFTASYTWKAYFDPSTGYIIGYSYVEKDTSSSGTGFTYTEDLYVDSTSYPLTTAPAGGGGPDLMQYAGYIVAIVIVIVLVAILIFAISRRRNLPKHPGREVAWDQYSSQHPSSGPSPQDIDLTPAQPPAQQIVIKEVVKVKCRYCGGLIDSAAERCPFCGAPRT